MYYLGIDSGATKASFLLTDETGRVFARSLQPGCAVLGARKEGVKRMVETGLREILQKAGIGIGEIRSLGLGINGYGEGEGTEQETQEACAEAFLPGRFVCSLDTYIAWAGSLLFEAGVNIISGTGSIVSGYTADGRSARAGGWGAGCDEGSCSWIGQRVVEAFTKQADGRAEKTPLYSLFREQFHFDGEDAHYVMQLNREIVRGGKGLAPLQMLLLEAWKQDDPTARRIYRAAADELALGVEAVASRLGMKDRVFPVSYSGGLFRSGACILDPLREILQKNGRILKEPAYDPDVGAVLMAIRHDRPEYDVRDFSLREE